MAKAVADSSSDLDTSAAGFSTDGSNITGFSHTHDSGTGGQPSLGNFPLFPQAYCPGDALDNCKFGSKYERAVYSRSNSVEASPGYFALTLDDGIRAEMTVTEHAALYHFKFPSGTPDASPISPLMLLDLTDLNDSR